MLARFDRWTAGPDRATFEGPAGRLVVTSPHAGVLRLCLLTPAAVGEKPAWAFEATAPARPVRASEERGAVVVSADGARCEISLEPLRWVFTGEGGERIEATACWIGEERRWPQEPHLRPLFEAGEEGTPELTAVLDGRFAGHGVTLSLAAPRERRYYGLGERAGWLDRRGRRHTNWTSDISPILPTTDALYQAIPFVLHLDDGRATGMLVDESWRTVFDLAATDPHLAAVRVDGPSLDVHLIAGPAPVAVLRRYAALTGRTPLPPLWSLGYHQSRWSYGSEAEVRDLVRTFRAFEIPLDAVHLDIDYMDAYKVFTWDRARFPDPARLARDLRADGVHLVVISEPSLKPEEGYRPYEEARAGGHLVRDGRGEVFRAEVWTDPAVFVDFLRPETRAWWGALFRPLLDAGISGIWDDMNEPSVRGTPGRTLPLDARHDTRTHLEVHNVYGLCHARATWEGLRALRPEERPFVISRSGYAGIQRYAAVWAGDNSSWWEHLEGSIPMLLNLGLSGVPFVGADIGGFHGHTEGELLVRWTQLGAFYPLMRNHTIRGSRRQEPWAFGGDVTRDVRAAIALRYALLPYLYSLMEEAATSGMPPMRPLFLHYPDDRETYHLSDQFLWGRDLLVAPAVRPGMRHRAVYFPEGRWAEWWTGALTEGPAWAVAGAPLDRIPLFLRAGGAVPTARPGPHTPVQAVWEEIEWRVHLAVPSSDGTAAPTPDARGAGPGAPADAAGASVEVATGRLFEDDGRTPADRARTSRTTRLAAHHAEGRVRLSLAHEGPLAVERRAVRVRCYGLGPGWQALEPPGAAVDADAGTLTVTLPAGATAVLLRR